MRTSSYGEPDVEVRFWMYVKSSANCWEWLRYDGGEPMANP